MPQQEQQRRTEVGGGRVGGESERGGGKGEEARGKGDGEAAVVAPGGKTIENAAMELKGKHAILKK